MPELGILFLYKIPGDVQQYTNERLELHAQINESIDNKSNERNIFDSTWFFVFNRNIVSLIKAVKPYVSKK